MEPSLLWLEISQVTNHALSTDENAKTQEQNIEQLEHAAARGLL